MNTLTQQRTRIITKGKPLVASSRNISYIPDNQSAIVNKSILPIDIRIAYHRQQLGLPKKPLLNLIKYN